MREMDGGVAAMEFLPFLHHPTTFKLALCSSTTQVPFASDCETETEILLATVMILDFGTIYRTLLRSDIRDRSAAPALL